MCLNFLHSSFLFSCQGIATPLASDPSELQAENGSVLPGRKIKCFLYFPKLLCDSVLIDVPSASEFIQHFHLLFTMTGVGTYDLSSFIGRETEGQKVQCGGELSGGGGGRQHMPLPSKGASM